MPTRSTGGRGASWRGCSSLTHRWSSTAGWGSPSVWSGGAAVGEFIAAAIAQFDFFEFVILNAHVVFPSEPSAGEASSRLFMCEVRQHGESGRMTTAFGLYHDRYLLDR